MKRRSAYMNKKGQVLFFVVLIAGILMTAATAAFYMLLQDLHMTETLINKIEAQYLAEAGISAALVVLIDNGFAAKNTSSNFPLTSLGSGTYDVTVIDSGGRTLLSGVGVYKGVSKTVVVEVKDRSPSSMGMALAAAGDITIKGVSGDVIINGDLHANGDMLLAEQGSGTTFSVESYGSATGKATSTGSYSATGVTLDDSANSGGGKPMLSFPSISFLYLKNIAIAEGTYDNRSSATFNDASLSGGAAGIYYLEGDATFKGDNTISGGFVAGGDIDLNNNNSIIQSHDAGNRFPVFISGDAMSLYGIITMDEGGIMYATNSVKIRTPGGISTVLGTVQSGGWYDIVANGDLTLTYSSVSIPELIPSGIDIVSWNK